MEITKSIEIYKTYIINYRIKTSAHLLKLLSVYVIDYRRCMCLLVRMFGEKKHITNGHTIILPVSRCVGVGFGRGVCCPMMGGGMSPVGGGPPMSPMARMGMVPRFGGRGMHQIRLAQIVLDKT